MNPREMIAIESRGYRDTASVGLKPMTEQLLEGDWLVVEIGGELVDPGAPRSVRFEGGRVTGRVGVNRFTGSFSIEGDVLEVGPVASTRMAGPPEMMALEDRFNSGLEGEHQITRDGEVLRLGESERTMVLTCAPGVSVQGTVNYRERIMLPPDSVVIVELIDISLAEIAVEPIASQVIADTTGPPFPFSLDSTEDIDGPDMLAVRGRILSAEGDLLWTTDTPEVVTDRAEPVELILSRVG